MENSALIVSLHASIVAFLADISEREIKQRENVWLISDQSLTLSQTRIYLSLYFFHPHGIQVLDFPKSGKKREVRRCREIRRENYEKCEWRKSYGEWLFIFLSVWDCSPAVTQGQTGSLLEFEVCLDTTGSGVATSACGTLSTKTKPYFKSHKVGVWVVASYICIYMWLARKRRWKGRLPKNFLLNVLAKCNFE